MDPNANGAMLVFDVLWYLVEIILLELGTIVCSKEHKGPAHEAIDMSTCMVNRDEVRVEIVDRWRKLSDVEVVRLRYVIVDESGCMVVDALESNEEASLNARDVETLFRIDASNPLVVHFEAVGDVVDHCEVPAVETFDAHEEAAANQRRYDGFVVVSGHLLAKFRDSLCVLLQEKSVRCAGCWIRSTRLAFRLHHGIVLVRLFVEGSEGAEGMSDGRVAVGKLGDLLVPELGLEVRRQVGESLVKAEREGSDFLLAPLRTARDVSRRFDGPLFRRRLLRRRGRRGCYFCRRYGRISHALSAGLNAVLAVRPLLAALDMAKLADQTARSEPSISALVFHD